MHITDLCISMNCSSQRHTTGRPWQQLTVTHNYISCQAAVLLKLSSSSQACRERRRSRKPAPDLLTCYWFYITMKVWALVTDALQQSQCFGNTLFWERLAVDLWSRQVWGCVVYIQLVAQSVSKTTLHTTVLQKHPLYTVTLNIKETWQHLCSWLQSGGPASHCDVAQYQIFSTWSLLLKELIIIVDKH